MRLTTSFLCTMGLAATVACSDDGLPVQGANSSTGGVETSPLPTTTDQAEGGPNDGTGVDTGQDGSAGTGSPPGDSTSSDPGTGTGTASDTGGSEGGTTGTSGTTGGTEGSTTGEPCMPITDDATAVGMVCETDLDCPDEYTCQPYVGFALQQTCQILCEQTCECPMGLTCTETVDKGGAPWFQCDP